MRLPKHTDLHGMMTDYSVLRCLCLLDVSRERPIWHTNDTTSTRSCFLLVPVQVASKHLLMRRINWNNPLLLSLSAEDLISHRQAHPCLESLHQCKHFIILSHALVFLTSPHVAWRWERTGEICRVILGRRNKNVRGNFRSYNSHHTRTSTWTLGIYISEGHCFYPMKLFKYFKVD